MLTNEPEHDPFLSASCDAFQGIELVDGKESDAFRDTELVDGKGTVEFELVDGKDTVEFESAFCAMSEGENVVGRAVTEGDEEDIELGVALDVVLELFTEGVICGWSLGETIYAVSCVKVVVIEWLSMVETGSEVWVEAAVVPSKSRY